MDYELLFFFFFFRSVVGLGHATTAKFVEFVCTLSSLSKSIESNDATSIVLSNTIDAILSSTVRCYAKCGPAVSVWRNASGSSIWCWRGLSPAITSSTTNGSWISNAELYNSRLSATIKCHHIPQSISTKFTKFSPTSRLFGLRFSTGRSIRWTIVSRCKQYGTVLFTNARSHQRCSTIQGSCV